MILHACFVYEASLFFDWSPPFCFPPMGILPVRIRSSRDFRLYDRQMIWETPNAGLRIACSLIEFFFFLGAKWSRRWLNYHKFPDPGSMACGSLKSGRMRICMTARLRFLRCRTRREFGVALRHTDTSNRLEEHQKLVGYLASHLTRERKRQKIKSCLQVLVHDVRSRAVYAV